jgi:hypothetical protein
MFKKDSSLDERVRLPILFTLFFYNHAITKGVWSVIANSKLYDAEFADANYEIPAILEECKGLECAAVWEPEHVVDRLLDYHAGRLNKWLGQLELN